MHFRALSFCTMARKNNQRLELCLHDCTSVRLHDSGPYLCIVKRMLTCTITGLGAHFL